LETDDNDDVLDFLRKYSRQFNQNLEDIRFSNLSKDFFIYLRRAFKYDLLEKRDGSIISSLLTENGNLSTDPDDINKQLITTLKELQLDLSKPYPINLAFPTLPSKSIVEMKAILSKLSTGKAIAWDGLTDSIFHKDLQDKTSLIFADLWDSLKQIPNIHFESRLIPLNKKHPNIPTRKDLRPIKVTSSPCQTHRS